MIVINCLQGSPEWHESRCGAITASMFGLCMDRLKTGANAGGFKEAALNYAFGLAIERISGTLLAEDQFETYAMRRGHELEPEARMLHEEKKEILVEQTGFVLTDDRKFGASVDGLFDPNGISEYKCFISPASLRPILIEEDIDSIMPQIQGGLWVTGRTHAHFVLYCPALECIDKHITIKEVPRDDNYINAMEEQLMEFDNLVESFKTKLMDFSPEEVAANDTEIVFDLARAI